jgi:hypothetical protein
MKLAKTILAIMFVSIITGGAYAADAATITDLSKGAKVSTIKAGGLRTSDRFNFVSVAKELIGLQCVCVSRGSYQKPGSEYSFKVDVPVTVFLLVDSRNSKFNADGWEKTGLATKWAGRYTDTVYKQDFPAGKITISANPAKILPNTAVIKVK